MQVILLEKIRNLGELGETVKVKRGFGRNFLLPQGKAVSATAANVEYFESKKAEFEAKAKEKLSVAQKRADSLNGNVIEIKAKASEEGKLFGSISVYEIIKAANAIGIELHKQEVLLPEGPIKNIGEFDLELSICQGEVKATIKLVISEDKG